MNPGVSFAATVVFPIALPRNKIWNHIHSALEYKIVANKEDNKETEIMVKGDKVQTFQHM